MLLWILFAILTVVVLAVLLRPLTTNRAVSATATDAADVAVYKDQLLELDADVARGLIGTEEAETARREIARRLLAGAATASAATSNAGARARTAALAVAGLVPIAALGTYLALGAPGVPGRPFANMPVAPIDKSPIDDLVAKVEARLASNPTDGQGWDVIAPVYFKQQRFDDAANAYARASALLGETTKRLAGFAESNVLAADGIVTEPARQAYLRILELEPGRIEPRFWLALAKEQDGRRADAAADYRALLASAPADATWRALVEERLAAVAGAAGSATTSQAPSAQSGPRGPSAADMKAAEGMTAKDRGEMIAGMVDSLAKRLAANPNDVDGWQRLVRSYLVLGARDKATATLADARRKLAGDPSAIAAFAALAKELGL